MIETDDGKSLSYDLVMPPQGQALTDPQLAKILTYVRSAWKNKETPVTQAEIAAQRKATASRDTMWTVEEILKNYPLPVAPSRAAPMQDLIASTYLGAFKNLADLRKFAEATEPNAVEEEAEGLIDVAQAAKKNNFGIIWEGKLKIPADGSYQFTLESDDGAAVLINGREVVKLDRFGPMGKPAKGKINLKAGSFPIRIEYYQGGGTKGIALAWSGPGIKEARLSKGTPPNSKPKPTIPIQPNNGEAVIYRNFIAGTTPRAIGVGYPEGVNLAFSADNCSLELLWTGKFMDGSRHWINRGQGNQPPAGENVVKLSSGPAFAILANHSETWPVTYQETLIPRFLGYELDKYRIPSFFYEIGPLTIKDTPTSQNKAFLREFQIIGSAPETTYLRLATGGDLKAASDGTFKINNLTISIPKGLAPVLENQSLLLPLAPSETTQSIQIRYEWK